MTLWVGTVAEEAGGRGACCSSEARALVSRAAGRLGRGDAEPALLHRHGPLGAPMRALQQRARIGEFSVRVQ